MRACWLGLREPQRRWSWRMQGEKRRLRLGGLLLDFQELCLPALLPAQTHGSDDETPKGFVVVP